MTFSDALIILGVIVFVFAMWNMSLLVAGVAAALVSTGLYLGRKEFP